MSEVLTLSLGCSLSDRTRPVIDGRVSIPNVRFQVVQGEPEDLFRRALRERAFEIAELSMGSHIVTSARGDSAYIGVPVFLSRSFRHSAIYVRKDRGIATAADLAGWVIGLPEYQQTAALWVRGILREQYGVDTRAIRWRIGSERIAITLPEGFDVAPAGESLDVALAEGRIDALIAPRPPGCFLNGTAPVARLFPDYRAEEEAWHKATGFFPLMHCLAVRRDVVEKHPWLPVELFRAFARAKAMSLEELAQVNFLRVSLPWIAAEAAKQSAFMGGNPWPYGFARNRDEIAAMIRFAVADGLAGRVMEPEELFHPSVLGLAE
ncbi:type 2 periplasmic-binding domain-containing protein [Plastoroseomonas arctica]|uniref:ABC transporter substrate-binding protein n=1 Tax=Plastoroseomonas arctica TaxID=1509237 RepID=A0AAF1JTW2_9PROT|nr:ABC transporter substrate-binding protein [Plastoroseomonas arctica]MBR0653530.1 ABC transporter substrate-binding protein [Plastoroseomonas arctica]